MLKRHSEFLKNLLFLSDLVVICVCWVGAYFIRFSVPLFPITKGIPPIDPVSLASLPHCGRVGDLFLFI